MENFTQSTENEKSVTLNNYALKQLNEARKWSMFLSVLGFIAIGLMVLFWIGIMAGLGIGKNLGLGVLSFVPLMVVLIIYFFPIYYLLKFSLNAKKAVEMRDDFFISSAIKFLKMHYQFMGILAIIAFAINLFAFVMAIIAASLGEMF